MGHTRPPLGDASEQPAFGGLSRRQFVNAVAWSAPAVVLATAVPAAAASVPLRVTIDAIVGDGTGTVRDRPGLHPWVITVTATNHSSVSVSVTISILPSAGTLQQPDTDVAVVPPGTAHDFTGFGQLVSTNGKTETLTAHVAIPSIKGLEER